MTNEKFVEQNTTVLKFIQIYCDEKHGNSPKTSGILNLNYQDTNLGEYKFSLCGECQDLLFYANTRLSECKHEIKPKCRFCKTPCYEKEKWKQMAKIMRSSGMKLGLIKIKNKILGNKNG